MFERKTFFKHIVYKTVGKNQPKVTGKMKWTKLQTQSWWIRWQEDIVRIHQRVTLCEIKKQVAENNPQTSKESTISTWTSFFYESEIAHVCDSFASFDGGVHHCLNYGAHQNCQRSCSAHDGGADETMYDPGKSWLVDEAKKVRARMISARSNKLHTRKHLFIPIDTSTRRQADHGLG